LCSWLPSQPLDARIHDEPWKLHRDDPSVYHLVGTGVPSSQGALRMSITEVAKLAGVSTSTVSRVINNHPRVAPETAAAVRKAMDTLSYAPSDRRPGPKPASRNRSTTGSIAFLAFGTSRRTATPGFGELLR